MAAPGLNSEEFLIKEGFLHKGSWDTPENVGTIGDPEDEYTEDDLVGYLRRGSIEVRINREYAKAESSTPAFIVRQDLIRKTFMLAGQDFQFDSATWALRDGLFVQTISTFEVGHIGFDEPVQDPAGFILKTQLTSGKPYNIGLYFGRALSEDISEPRTGDDYVSPILEITAFPHPNFNVFDFNDAIRCYGSRWSDTA